MNHNSIFRSCPLVRLLFTYIHPSISKSSMVSNCLCFCAVSSSAVWEKGVILVYIWPSERIAKGIANVDRPNCLLAVLLCGYELNLNWIEWTVCFSRIWLIIVVVVVWLCWIFFFVDDLLHLIFPIYIKDISFSEDICQIREPNNLEYNYFIMAC